MKIKIKIIFLLVAIVTLISTFFIYLNRELTEKQAFLKLFGNYDPVHKISLWKNMNFPKDKEDSYFEKKTGITNKILYQPYKENGNKKILLITKTIPIDFPFECHACYPLISAATFSKHWNKWEIESKNLFLMYGGQYGIPPKVNLVQIGQDKYGVTLEYEQIYGESDDKQFYLAVPYNEEIKIAFEDEIYFNNFNHCCWSTQCTAYSSEIHFDNSKKVDFYPFKIKKFGTRNDETQEDRAVPVNEESVYEFRNGKYMQVSGEKWPQVDCKALEAS